MEVKQKSLIQVSTLTAKLAKQIEKVPYCHDGVGKEICAAFEAGMTTDVSLPPYWTWGRMLDGMPDNVRCWLIQYKGQWYWMVERGEEWCKKHMGAWKPQQLFIS